MNREERIASSSSPWVEKYRPHSIGDVAHQNEVVAALSHAVERGAGNLPHLLFYGPPGTGKTSIALALARQIFPEDVYRQRVMELNASDERGIRVVREKIKVFAKGVVATSKSASGRIIPPFKVIILDEADAVTSEAQTALRRTMETYSKVTRFILICNYISRIISPLASRCAKFRFEPLPVDISTSRLRHICNVEDVIVKDDVLRLIVESTDGDLRKAITILQTAFRLVPKGQEITAEAASTASCDIPISVVKRFRDAMRPESNFDQVRNAVDEIIRNGFPADRLLHQVTTLILDEGYDSLDELQKAALAIKFARAERYLGDGASERLQLLDVGARGLKIANSRGNLPVLLME